MSPKDFTWKKNVALCVILLGAVGLTRPDNSGPCTGPCNGSVCTISSVSGPSESGEISELKSMPSWDSNEEKKTKVPATKMSFSTACPIHSPRLSLILPTGVQRGTSQTFQFYGRNLGDAQELIFYSKGFQFSELKKVNENRISAKISVGKEVRPGRHLVQVRTKTGVSDFRPVWVNVLPTCKEKEPNSLFTAQQKISMNVSVEGTCTSEDIDYYQVHCKKGQRLSVEVTAMRLGNFLFDPYIAVLNKDRFELASCDDSPFAGQDGFVSVKIPEDGDYTIVIRETSFAGSANCRYQLHVGTFPRPSVLFPAGGKAGEKTSVKLIGDPLGEPNVEVTVPANEKVSFPYFASDSGGMAPSGNPFVVSKYSNSFEKEPNHTFKVATEVPFPSAVNGVLEKDGDNDFYKFKAKKGQVWDIEVFAKRIGSPVDPVFHLFSGARKYMTGNDDSRGHDSYLRFTVPADGEYYFRIKDHLNRGGKSFVYRVEFRPVSPTLEVSIPRTERYGQYRQTIFVPKGGRFGTVLMATRRNFGGPLVLQPGALPKGVKVHCQQMPANMTQMPVVFEASAGAPLASQLVPMPISHADPKVKIKGQFSNKADLVLGIPNNSVYQSETVDSVPVAVIEEVPFDLSIDQPKSPIVRGGTKNIVVRVKRKNKFKGAIVVEFPFRPPGIGTRRQLIIPAGKDVGYYPLNANSKAQISQWPVFAIGSANIKGGRAFCSSQLAQLSVANPYVTCSMARVSVEQEKEVLLACKLNQLTSFEGKATAKLYGLPPGVTTGDVLFDKTAKEIVFKLTATKAAKIGKHRGVFCQVIVPVNGEKVVSRGGSTEVQVFRKPVPKKVIAKKKGVKPAVKAVAKKEPKVEKPLSRLQKLRQQRKEKQTGGL